jgi:hypothetical protein
MSYRAQEARVAKDSSKYVSSRILHSVVTSPFYGGIDRLYLQTDRTFSKDSLFQEDLL